MEGLRKKCLAGFTKALQIGGESTTFQGGEDCEDAVTAFDAVFLDGKEAIRVLKYTSIASMSHVVLLIMYFMGNEIEYVMFIIRCDAFHAVEDFFTTSLYVNKLLYIHIYLSSAVMNNQI